MTMLFLMMTALLTFSAATVDTSKPSATTASMSDNNNNGNDELQSPDFYAPKAVRIRNFVNKPSDSVDKSWPPANAHEFSRIDITVMGKKVDGATLHNLVPDMRKMKAHLLRKLLEPDYDTEWMSISKPAVFTGQQQPDANPFAVDVQLSTNVNRLNFTFMDELGSPFLPDPRIIYMFKSWLLRQASCPLEYLWEDLGVLFWPRWIKRGMCSSGQSCSWPAGMRCRPNGSRPIRVLRWVCTEEERRDYRQYRRSNEKGAAPDELQPSSQGNGRSARKPKNRVKDRAVMRQRRKLVRQRRLNKLQGLSDQTSDEQEEKDAASGEEHRPKRPLGRRRRKLMRRLSSQIGGYKCQWMTAEIPVVHKCACMCR